MPQAAYSGWLCSPMGAQAAARGGRACARPRTRPPAKPAGGHHALNASANRYRDLSLAQAQPPAQLKRAKVAGKGAVEYGNKKGERGTGVCLRAVLG